VTAKPQTTRSRILGIHSLPSAQIVFIDTPGLHRGGKLLNAVLNEAVEETVRDCELALLLVDLRQGWTPAHDELIVGLRAARTPTIVVGNKRDLAAAGRAAWPPSEAGEVLACHRVSARTGKGIPALLERIIDQLPESPSLYPEDDLTDRSLRWLAAELVREALFEELQQELPYGMAVELIDFDESRPEMVKLRANLLVVRDSQKRIVIGSGGRQIKRIGVRARREIEALLGTRVHLELWVKVDPSWAKDKDRIEELGYG
jgi:GTP-binding protein Era